MHIRKEALISILNSHPSPLTGSTTFNLVNKYGQNLANVCAQLSYHHLLTFVIEQGVDIGVREANGWMLLDFACFYGNLNVVDFLEGDWECDVKVPEQGPLRFEPGNLISLLPVLSHGVPSSMPTSQSTSQST